LVSFALLIAGGLVAPLWNVPGSTATATEIADYVGRHRTAFLVALLLYACGVSLWLALFSAVRQRLTAVSPAMAAVFGSASTALTVLVLTGFVPMLTLAYRAPQLQDARTLYDLSFGLLALSGLPTALALSMYAVGGRKGDRLLRGTACVAAIAAAAHVAIAGSLLFRSGFLSLEGGDIVAIPATLFVWILLASIVELRREPPAGAKPAPAK
jgi:uncharacterized membrane-anchored protein YitT (DUF2179 family)